MAYIELGHQTDCDKKLMLFVEGTILKPKSWLSLYSHKAYIPIGDCVSIIRNWSMQGFEIIYCTAQKKYAVDIAKLLKQYEFTGTKLYYRSKKQSYAEIVEEIKPAILIEDDCRSIGGSWQMCITKVSNPLKEKIQSIIVPEFGGIDFLSDTMFE